jgi:hypothetical protein
MPGIFLSYRRSDSQSIADRLYDRLLQEFSAAMVFRDIDSIPLGADFRRVIEDTVTQADVFLVIVGPTWVNATDENGNRRLDDPDDFVRIEIETALKRPSITVVPITVANAPMPKASELPRGLCEFAYRQGTSVRHDPDFHRDVARLIFGIRKLCGSASSAVHPLTEGVSDDFVEVLKYRAEGVVNYILDQQTAALSDACSQSRREIERRYQKVIENFRKLHEQYLKALRAGKAQLAHETIENLHQLIEKCRHKKRDDGPPPMLREAGWD